MTRIRSGLLVRLTVAALGACGEGSAPLTPIELQITAGSGQTGPAGGELPLPLSVTVIGSNGRPLANVPVAWQVTVGSASLAPRAPSSDQNGVAEAVVTLGALVGPVEVHATTSGLTPAAFHASTVDPCSYVAPHALGGSSSGYLRSGDCVTADGSFLDWYRLTVPAAQAVRITMASESLDAWVGLYGRASGDDARIAFSNDADGTTTDGAIKALVTAGDFVMAASSFGGAETGPYTVTSAVTSSDVAGCERVWVIRGVVTMQQLRASDCVDSSGPWYADGFLLWMTAGEGVSLAAQSSTFQPYLFLFDGQGTLIGEAGPGTDGTARLSYTATARGGVFFYAASETPGAEGAYTLTVATTPGDTVAMHSGVLSHGADVLPPAIAGPRRWLLPTGRRQH